MVKKKIDEYVLPAGWSLVTNQRNKFWYKTIDNRMCALRAAKYICQFLAALEEHGDELEALKSMPCLELFFNNKKRLEKKAQKYRERMRKAGVEVGPYAKRIKTESEEQDKRKQAQGKKKEKKRF